MESAAALSPRDIKPPRSLAHVTSKCRCQNIGRARAIRIRTMLLGNGGWASALDRPLHLATGKGTVATRLFVFPRAVGNNKRAECLPSSRKKAAFAMREFRHFRDFELSSSACTMTPSYLPSSLSAMYNVPFKPQLDLSCLNTFPEMTVRDGAVFATTKFSLELR